MSSSKKNPLTHVLATNNAHEPFLLERQNPDRSDALYMAKTIDQDLGKGHENQNIMIEETTSYELVESKRQRGSGCAAKEGSSDESKALRPRRQGPATPEAGKGMGRGVREAKSTKGEISEDSSVGRKGSVVNGGVAEVTGGERRGAECLDYDASWSSAGLSGDEAHGVTNFASSPSNSRRDGQVDKKREFQVQWMKGNGGGDHEPANEHRSPLRCCSCVLLMLMLVPEMLLLCFFRPFPGIVLHFHVQIVLCAD
jgi:hypothetical protein